MKNLFLAALLLLGICSFKTPSKKEDLKALAAENSILTKRTDSLYNSVGEVNRRIEKVNAMASQKNQTAANMIPVYQKECDYLTGVLEKAQYLKKSIDEVLVIIKQTDKEINKDMSTTETERTELLKELDRIGMENSMSNDKIKEVIKSFTGHRDRTCKTLKRLKEKAEN